MKPEKKATYTKYNKLLRFTSRDTAPGSHQVRPESLETFQPSYASSEVNLSELIFTNDAIRNRISDIFDKRRISQPKTQ